VLKQVEQHLKGLLAQVVFLAAAIDGAGGGVNLNPVQAIDRLCQQIHNRCLPRR
jgi:hypothetical protein